MSHSFSKSAGIFLPALVLACFVTLLPLAHMGVKEHPDEKHYTDAALIMLESGDLLTPRTYTGDLRVNKPPGVYWLILASFKTLGVSLFSSRLPSALAGVGLLLLVYFLGKALTQNEDTALLAVALQASDSTFWLLSNRTTPDIFLTFGITLGFLGLAKQWKASHFDGKALCLITIGSFIAGISKGLLGVVFLFFALISLHIRYPGIFQRHLRWILGGVLLWILGTGSWLLMLGPTRAMAFAHQFFHDQFIDRLLSDGWLLKPLHMLSYAALIPLSFLFWLPWLWRRGVFTRLRNPTTLPIGGGWLKTVLAWTGLLCLIFGMGNKVTTRYVFSAIPLWSVLLADAARVGISPKHAPWSAVRLRWWTALTGLGILAALSIPVTAIFTPFTAWTLPGVWLILLLAGSLRARASSSIQAVIAVPIVIWSLLPILSLYGQVLELNSPGRQLAAAMDSSGKYRPDSGTLTCDFPRLTLSRSRVFHGHFCDTLPVIDFILEGKRIDTPYLLLPEPYTGAAEISPDYEPVETWSLIPASPAEVLRNTREENGLQAAAFLRLLRQGYPAQPFTLYRLGN